MHSSHLYYACPSEQCAASSVRCAFFHLALSNCLSHLQPTSLHQPNPRQIHRHRAYQLAVLDSIAPITPQSPTAHVQSPQHFGDNKSSAMAHTPEIVVDEDAVKRRFDMDSGATCSLSIGELVASAFVLCRAGTLSQSEIENCIRDHHPYFRRGLASGDDARDQAIRKLPDNVVDYTHLFTAPLFISERSDGDMAVSISPGSVYNLLKGSIQGGSSSVYQAKSPEPGCFPFHKLPDELKFMVFYRLCTYPSYRLSFESCDQTAMFAYPITSAADGWIEEAAWSWIPSLADLLAPLLLCNKHFKSLACQTFYGLNDFQCSDLATLNWFLEIMGPEGRQYVKRITVRYHRLKEAQKLVEIIKECTSLKSLTLIFKINHKQNGNMEVSDNKGHGNFTYDEPSAIPGLKGLKSIFMPEKPNVVKISACPTSQCVQKVKAYMYECVSSLN